MMRNMIYSAFLSFLLSIIPIICAQELLWSDEFNGASQFSQNWSYDTGAGGWGNQEIQSYEEENVAIDNGNLVISVREEQTLWDSIWGNRKITSGRIHSQKKLEYTYGRVEARIQNPNPANGLWPCLWMLGSNFDVVGWPASGSMTLMQMGSAEALEQNQASTTVGSALFWQADGGVLVEGNDVNTGFDLTTDFHTYVMEWTPESITMSVDGVELLSKDISEDGCPACDELHRSQFFIINVAVGGKYMNLFQEWEITAPLPAEMLVDYIRYAVVVCRSYSYLCCVITFLFCVRIYDNGFTQLSGSSTQTDVPTVSPTLPPTTLAPTTTAPLPTLPPTEAATTIAPSTAPQSTAPPTTTSPTTAPTTTSTTSKPTTAELPNVKDDDPTAEPSDAPNDSTVQTAQASDMKMLLTNVGPLDTKSAKVWADITQTFLKEEVENSIDSAVANVNVVITSQNPPYIGGGRNLRILQSQEQQQEIVFNAVYEIQSDTQVNGVESYVTGAFVSNYKKAIYLERLKDGGGATFENVSYVSVEATKDANNDVSSATGSQGNTSAGRATDIGLIVGVATAGLVVLILSLALYARRRKRQERRRDTPVTDNKDMTAARLNRSGTIDEESLYTSSSNHPRSKVAPSDERGGLDQASSYFSFRNFSLSLASNKGGEDEMSSSGLSSSAVSTQEYNYRDAYVNASKSIGTGLTPESDQEQDGKTVCDEFVVEAPKGKLGLILETSDEGCPVVQAIKPDSPLNGCVQVGDRLHSVDGRDVTMVMAETVSRVIASKANSDNRKFVFARPQ